MMIIMLTVQGLDGNWLGHKGRQKRAARYILAARGKLENTPPGMVEGSMAQRGLARAHTER